MKNRRKKKFHPYLIFLCVKFSRGLLAKTAKFNPRECVYIYIYIQASRNGKNLFWGDRSTEIVYKALNHLIG